MKHLGKILFLFLLSQTSFAEVDSSKLVKVTPENNPKCVEYYRFQGSLYCSTVALSTEPVDPKIKDYEKLNIVFDNRPWLAAWGKDTPKITTVEYVPQGDNILKWNELVTSQFIPIDDHNDISPMEFANSIVYQIKQAGFNPTINFIEIKPNQVIFEFRITTPNDQQQDELQRIIKTKDGFYILHYVIKKPDMGSQLRNQWVKNLQQSTVKK